MGLFDPNAEVRTGFTPSREHVRIVKAEVKVCKSGRDSINFEFKTDADKTRYKTVTVNSIFSSVIKGMMIGVGIDYTRFAEADLYDIANAFKNTDGDAWTSIPKDKEYPEPQYFFPKGSKANGSRSYETFSDGSPVNGYANGKTSQNDDFPDEQIPF
jgi:hypothetical protein